jgi:hypothetical protein
MCDIWRLADITFADSTVRTTASFGITTHNPRGASFTGGDLLRNTEVVLTRAIEAGGDRVAVEDGKPAPWGFSPISWVGFNASDGAEACQTCPGIGP